MDEFVNCSDCELIDEKCSKEQIAECLRKSTCEYCDSIIYHYPYGKEESRHCWNCGAEWPVYK